MMLVYAWKKSFTSEMAQRTDGVVLAVQSTCEHGQLLVGLAAMNGTRASRK